MPAWIVGLSIFATYVSSISFLALPGKAYATNWNTFVFSLSIPLASWMTIRYFIPLYRGTGNISAYYYLEQRFGPWARMYASLCYILTQLMRTGAILMLLALPLNALFGWNMKTIIILIELTVMLYLLKSPTGSGTKTNVIRAGILFSITPV